MSRHDELQQALQVVLQGSTAVQYAATARSIAPSTQLASDFTTRAILGPLRLLADLVCPGAPLPAKKLPTPRVRRKPTARRVSRAVTTKAGLPKPVDLCGLDRRLPWRAVDNLVLNDGMDPQLEASNCRALLLEIIRRAAFDWVLYRGSSKLASKMLADSAYQWLFVEEPESTTWPIRQRNGKELTGFVTICGLLDVDPDRVRSTVRAMTERDIMGAGRPAERRKGKAGEEAMHGDDLKVFDVNVDELPLYDCMFAPEPLGG